MSKALDLTGQRFGRYTVLEKAPKRASGGTYWVCKCDCGNVREVSTAHLRRGDSKSCGCLRADTCGQMFTTHGLSKHPLHKVWEAMLERCDYPNNKRYRNYGGRGITVCDEWRDDFKTFYDWSIAHGYAEGLTIDRIDVNGDYEPTNCRWVTWKDQSNNTTTNRYITYGNKTQTLTQWSEELGINKTTLRDRLESGWSVEKAFTTPLRRTKHD